IAAVLAAGLEAGLLEVGDDVLGRLVDTLGAGAAPLALGGGQVGDVLLHPRLALLVRRVVRGERDRRAGGQYPEQGADAAAPDRRLPDHAVAPRWKKQRVAR